MSVTAILDLELKADSLEHAHQVIHEILTDTRAFAGCLGVSVLVDCNNPAHVILVETWESADHDKVYRKWRAGAGASNLGSVLAVTPKLGLFTVAEGV